MRRRCVMIVIPEVTKEINAISNFDVISTVVNKWPVNGEWEQVIDDNGPIYLKDGERYHAYCLDADRIELADVSSFVYREETDFSGIANIELGHITEWTPQEWLENNGYENLVSGIE